MNEEIGTMAGLVWRALEGNGGMTLAKLKKELSAQGPVFDWAIGWLAREDKLDLSRNGRSFQVSLKGQVSPKGREPQQAAHAA